MNISAIIQARMGSSRLPGKVLKEINSKPMVLQVIERLKKSKKIDNIVLVIPDTKENDILESFCLENRINYFRGSEADVLSRYYGAAEKFNSDVIVRITSDCPLIDPEVVDWVIEKHLSSGADYTSNVFKRTFPRGFDTEVFNFEVLKKAYQETKESYQREHVTPYIWQNPEIFRIESVEASAELNYPEFRLTVDTEKDLELIRRIFDYLPDPGIKKVIGLLKEKPELVKLNSNVKQKDFKDSISLRRASFSDIEFLWYLRNRPETQKYSHQRKGVDFSHHIEWIMPIILGISPKILFVIERNKKPIGQVRFDFIEKEKLKISISILKEFQGRGIGKESLSLAIKEIGKEAKEIIAEIYEENIPSLKLFEKLGFKFKKRKDNLLTYVWTYLNKN